MPKHKYTTPMEGARAVGRDLAISTKNSVEVCRFIKGKTVQTAKRLLREVIALKRAVPYKRYYHDVGHKSGMSAGRFPQKTSSGILRVLESAETNAQFKGMNTAKLYVAHIAAQKASTPMHGGRKRGQSMKRTHVEMVLQEKNEKKEQERKKEPFEKSARGETK